MSGTHSQALTWRGAWPSVTELCEVPAPGSVSRHCSRIVTHAACSGPGTATMWLAAESRPEHARVLRFSAPPSSIHNLALGLQGAAGESAEAFADSAARLLTSKADMLQECVGLGIDTQGAVQMYCPQRCLHGHSELLSLHACAHESWMHVMSLEDKTPASRQSVDHRTAAGRTCHFVTYGLPCYIAPIHAALS